jgi:hypothetical protein
MPDLKDITAAYDCSPWHAVTQDKAQLLQEMVDSFRIR